MGTVAIVFLPLFLFGAWSVFYWWSEIRERFFPENLKPDPMQETVDMVLLSLETIPEEWRQDSHYLVHQPSGISIWTANDDFGISINNTRPNAVNRKTLHKAIRKSQSVTLANAIRNGKRP